MNHRVIFLELEGLQDLDCESPDQTWRNTSELIGLDKFVQIHAQKLKRDDQVLAKHFIVKHADDVVFVMLIALIEKL